MEIRKQQICPEMQVSIPFKEPEALCGFVDYAYRVIDRCLSVITAFAFNSFQAMALIEETGLDEVL